MLFSIETLLLFAFLLPSAPALGIFDSLFTTRHSANNLSESRDDTLEQPFKCEDTRIVPRIASAIIGGRAVKDQRSVAYMAAIGEREQDGSILWFCGGSLLSERIVLTAAHCLSNRVAKLVRLGATDHESKATAQDLAVASSVIHPDYKSPESYHDLAVIRLATAASLSKSVRPICLARSDEGRRSGEITSVIGWGAETLGGRGSQELRQVKVKIFNSHDCDKVYSNSSIGPKKFPRGIADDQLCAGSPEGGKDACQGDSGGPLVVEGDWGVVRLLGIVSSGAGCGSKEFPGVYVRVSAYDEWIKQYLN